MSIVAVAALFCKCHSHFSPYAVFISDAIDQVVVVFAVALLYFCADSMTCLKEYSLIFQRKFSYTTPKHKSVAKQFCTN